MLATTMRGEYYEGVHQYVVFCHCLACISLTQWWLVTFATEMTGVIDGRLGDGTGAITTSFPK